MALKHCPSTCTPKVVGGLGAEGVGESLIRLYLLGVGIFFFVFLGPHLQHMQVPRLGVELELQPLANNTAMATPDP